MTESPSTIDELVRHRAAQYLAKPLVIDPVNRITFAELDQHTHAMAAAFLEAGATKGTRVGLIMPNGTAWVRTAIALTRIGAVLVPLSTLLAPPDIVAQLRAQSVQCLVAADEFGGDRYLDEMR